MSLKMSGVGLVTGASSGIGLALAIALATSGMSLYLTGRNPARLSSAASTIRARGGRAVWRPADLGNDAELRGLADWVKRDAGSLDVLAHSAGSIHLGDIEAVDWDDLDSDYRINLRAPFLLTKLLLPLLSAAKGQLVFINSTAGLAAGRDNALYAATKHGLRSLAGSIREQVNDLGIRVLSVFPGRTDTPMQEAVLRFEGRSYRPEELLRPEEVAEIVLASLTLPRSAEVVDVVMRPSAKPSGERSAR